MQKLEIFGVILSILQLDLPIIFEVALISDYYYGQLVAQLLSQLLDPH